MARSEGYLKPLLEATARIQHLQKKNKSLGQIKLEEMISTRPHAAVFRGKLKRKTIALKLFLEHPTETCQAQAEELTYLSGFMGSGPYRVPDLIHSFPGAGACVMSFIEGPRFDQVLREASAKDRTAAIERAAEFLWHLSRPRRRRDVFGGKYWLKRAAKYADDVRIGPRRDLADRVLDSLSDQHAKLAGTDIVKARSHGDFSPVNLIENKDGLWGIDIQNAHWLPLAKDAARFLVYVQTNMPRTRGARYAGLSKIDAEPFRAYLEALGQEDYFRFFIGVEYLDKYSRRHADLVQSGHLEKAMIAYLEEI